MQAEDRRLRALMAQIQAEQREAQKTRTPKPEAPLRLALAVQNLEGTRAHIQAILSAMGGSLTVKPPKAGPHSDSPDGVQASAPVNSSAGQKRDAPPTQIASALTLLVRVPADRARTLLDNLQQMGALSEIAPDSDAARGPFKMRAALRDVERKPGEEPASRPGGKAAQTVHLALSEHLRRIEESLRKRGDWPPDALLPPSRARPFVTILLRLQPQQATANRKAAGRQ
jgi:hypothetical protein